MNQKSVFKLVVLMVSIVVIVFSVSYAFLSQTLKGVKKQVVSVGNLEAKFAEGNEIYLINALPTYDDVGMLQDPFAFSLSNNFGEEVYYKLILEDVTTSEQKLDASLVKCGFTKNGNLTIQTLSKGNPVLDVDSIGGGEVINYTLRLWISSSVRNEDLIKNKSLSYQVKVELEQKKTAAESLVFDTSSQRLEQNCKVYNDNTTTTLVGQCSNNYVWYSGKLWRIVSKDNRTGTTSLIMDNAITAIPSFSSFGRKWLKEEFLPTLHDYENYLEISKYESSPFSFLTSSAYKTVYEKSGGLATSETNYLNNGTSWALGDSRNGYVYSVDGKGGLSFVSDYEAAFIRPVIRLKSDVNFSKGTGTIDDPYVLLGDEQETIGGVTPLNTRYSGEYVNFDNRLYRIVETGNSFTKVASVNVRGTDTYNNTGNLSNIGNALIFTRTLSNYKSLITKSYQDMMATYGWPIKYCKTNGMCDRDASTLDYRSDSIGLPNLGEMFTSPISRTQKADFWTQTFSEIGYFSVWYFRSSDGRMITNGQYTKKLGVRPSIYLKSNVVIAKNNTGNGTYEHPYTIELAE